ncbi:putative microtubule associated protein [Lyophyllum shimeji]|uniref:Microtubule associated protein n=1 Tax=Lyophyllum shimeji TaxID=47721 RepID=A0A9P3PFM0_LYOSH|nr:putative microtubule associated protein [Lyophyllum shimeji]
MMEDAPPPPTDHVLRPHHVGLLTILVLTFKEPADSRKIPPAFLLHLYRVLLNEISEVSRPMPYQELMQIVCNGPSAESNESQRMIAAIKAAHADLKSAEQITNFFGNLPSLFVEKGEDEPPILMRRSIFGYFSRRCFFTFIKLSFSGVVKLQKDYQAWCLGDLRAGYEVIVKDQLNNSDLLIFKTQADKKSWAKPDAYEVWERAHVTGDENIATENLRRFFEQHFHENNDSGLRQHALLNLVRMHYLRGEVTAARKLLTEAITVSRTSGDRITLQHCISLLHRLPPTVPGRKPVLNEIQPVLHPLEVLFDVKKLVDPQNDQPLSAAFSKISQAVGVYDHWLDSKGALLADEEQWAQHAVQSIVWDAAGCSQLASLEESIVIACTQPGGDDHNRITVLLNKAYKKARQGAYTEALTMLLDPDVWRGLSINDYTAWACEIWHILVLRATRRGQDRLYREYLLPRRPPGDYNPRAYVNNAPNPSGNKTQDPLYEVIQMRRHDQATASIEQLLKGLWHSEFLLRLNDYRTGIILLADVMLEFGMSKRSRRILEDIMPQVINGNDLEQRAFACFTFARSILAARSCTAAALEEALPYLLTAEGDYRTLQINNSLLDVQYLLSVFYHNLGMVQERDEAAKRHHETQTNKQRLNAVVVEDEIQQVLEVVALVGAGLAGTRFLLFQPCLKSSEPVFSGMDGPPPQEEDFSALPIQDRLAHKNWKARVSAYESLVKTFQTTASDTDPAFKPYINNPDLLKKIVTDSNAVAQEKGVECLVAFVKFAGETAAKTREVVLPALVDKCFGSSRAGTKTQAVELTLQYVEVENAGAGVVNDILPGLGAKQPKTVAGCIFALKEIVRVFGTQVTPPPPLLKALPKIFSHSDKTVRAEGTTLTHVLYQYIGPGIEPWLADLKPVQVKELKEAFEGMESDGKGKGTLKPERLTRQQAREAETLGDDTEEARDTPGGEPEEAVLDPRAFAEPVDIVPKLSPTLQVALKSSKWKERKEALDDLVTLLTSTPRIQDAPELGELAKSLASRVSGDANINCVMVAASCIEELAKGLMSAFGKYREAVVPLMLERMKERKASVTDGIGTALDAVFATTTLPDIIPDLEPSLKSKNPQVKEGTLKFLGRCLATSPSPIQPAQIKPISETLAILLEDGFEGARNEAATCLGTLMKMVGERPLNALMDGLADVRKAKVQEAYQKATVKCTSAKAAPPKAAPKPAAPPTKAAAPKKALAVAKPPAAEANETPEAKPPASKPPVKAAAKKPPAVIAAAAAKKPAQAPAASAKPSKPTPSAGAGALDTFKYKHTPEDAEALAAETLPPSIMNDLGDANWKTRLAALEELLPWVESELGTLDAEVLVRALAKKCWAEKNFQVSAKLYAILALLAGKCPSFGRSCVALCVAHLTEKLGDMKLKKPAGEALSAFSEKISLQFVLNQAYDPLSKVKAPKVLADALTWVNTALIEFGIAGIALRSLIEFLKTSLQNSNAAVRTSATKTLVTVKLFAGSSIKDFLEDLNPQLLNTITSEFDKVEGTPSPEPTRTSADLANMASSGSGSAGRVQQGDPLDDLFPRVDVDGLLRGTTILADAKSESWKTKKEALEAFQAILDQGSNKRLKGTMGEIGQVLKARVVDTNKAVQILALDIVCRISAGMGKPFEKHARLVVAPICTVLADQKAPIRAAALQALTSITTACDGVDAMVHGIATGLETTNPLQKGTLFNWLADWFKEHPPPPTLDLNSLAGPVVTSLDDRNSDVRKGAQALLPPLITCAGFDYVMQQTNSLKPASRSSAIPLIQAARPTPAPALAQVPATKPTKPVAPPTSDSPPPEPSVASAPLPAAVGPKLTGVRRKLPQGTTRPESRPETPIEASSSRIKAAAGGLSRPPAAGVPPPQMPAHSLPFYGVSLDAKKARCGKDAQKWINEGGPTRKDLADLLQSQMEPHASKDLVARLFSHDHNAVNDHIQGLTTISDFFANAQDADENVETVCLANLDLPLKYVSIKVHEPQPNLVSKCLDVVEVVLGFLRGVNYQLTDGEAICFIPTMIFKLGDAREQVRGRVQQIIRTLPMVYAYSRVFHLLLDHGLKSKVAKTRQGSLDEMASILKKSGMGACEPTKAFPLIAAMISDKDSQVRKSALGALSEGYTLVGEKVWSLVGPLPPKDKTQLEERLRRVPAPSSQEKPEVVPSTAPAVARLAVGNARPGSPLAAPRITALPRPGSPAVAAGTSRLARPASPAKTAHAGSPTTSGIPRSESPVHMSRVDNTKTAVPTSPKGIARPKSMLPSRLGRPRPVFSQAASQSATREDAPMDEPAVAYGRTEPEPSPSHDVENEPAAAPASDDITLTISSILSSDPSRSVEALKKIQKILALGPETGPSDPQYRELADHTEGLIETITLQMAHVFERPEDLIPDDNFRLAKHLIQTLNNFCDHAYLAESLTVDILTSLLEELTLRLLETDDSHVKKVKDLSRFINMIILRLFATGRRMSIFRALFALLLQIVKPFPSNGTLPDSKEAKVAELVLKCVWKLARNIPQDLSEQKLDPVELFPAIEHFLQSVPPNEWRARATNKVPCGDMPLRTIKVIIQHVVAHYGDDVYDLLSAAFDDPSATIVYPYVYRILNSSSRPGADVAPRRNGASAEQHTRPVSPTSSRPISPQGTASSANSVGHRRSPSHRTSPSSSSANGNGTFSPAVEEPDPDAQLLAIIGHISSETTGALHKEGITELHHFLKAYPHKRPRVEKMLESTGAAFRKYINRALASRAAEDQERNVVVADTLTKLESNHRDPHPTSSPVDEEMPTRRTANPPEGPSQHQDKLSRLHDIFQYRSSTHSTASSQGRNTRISPG